MTIELTLLIWSPVLFALYLGPQSIFYRLEHGFHFAGGGRDNEPPAKGVYLQRSEKALRNFLETYGVFIALAVGAELSHNTGGLTTAGAAIYFAARIIYLPLYVTGVQYGRSAVWVVSGIGLAMMFLGVAF